MRDYRVEWHEIASVIELDAAQIRLIEASVPGGADNIQDIYPLMPLQEGILFHHSMQSQGDVYLLSPVLGFDSSGRLQQFVEILGLMIQRHDILRTAVLWEGLREPLQVVYRHAQVQLEWLENADGNALEHLQAHIDPRHHRIDVRKAPMIRAMAVEDAQQRRWLLGLMTHHLVLDHETLARLMAEIASIQRGGAQELSQPLSFRRFVAQARRGTRPAEHEAFFRGLLSGVDEPTMPFGLSDIHAGGNDIDEVRIRLSDELAQRIRRQAQRNRATPAVLFHLAWALVLGKVTGKEDVVFGTVLFGRLQGVEGAERAMGMFLNTLPVRVRLGARSVKQCVRQTHEVLAQLMDHEAAGLSLAQRCSGLSPGTPLFSALLNYRYSLGKPATGNAGSWEGMKVLRSGSRTNYPITMSVEDLGQGFELVAQVDRSVRAVRVCEYLSAAIAALVTALGHGERLICELDLLNAAEHGQLRAWGRNDRRYLTAQPVHRLIETEAAARPDATALIFADETLTYGELNARANRLAHRLISLGVKPETIVGIALERSFDMVVGLLAVLKAGGAYVPLDPDYPVERLSYMLLDSGVRLLLTASSLVARLPTADLMVTLPIDTLDLSDEPHSDPQVAIHEDALAYVIYTSGSTGRPKAAANRHGSLYNRLAWMQDAYELSETDVVLQKTPFSFDVSVWEFFWPLMQGARLAIAEPGAHRDPQRLVELIARHGVSTLHFVPSMLHAFLQHDGIDVCTSLRRIVCSGEALSIETQSKVFARLPWARLYNLYGPTEAAIDVTHWSCVDDDRGTVPIGRPIAATRTVVLDSGLNLVPPGMVGELYLGGVGLARGYLNRSGLSSERFVADPLSANGERLYRTGDLVRWSEDGQLEYLSRIDHQVKIRGFRIELGEIESQLRAQPEVREAVVAAKEGPGGSRLVAYVVAAAADFDTSILRERLSKALPDYMLPAAIVVLESLPLTHSGKLDRRALPEAQVSHAGYEAPQGDIEIALAAIWSNVLGVERVGRHDNFFQLGGDSILSLKIVAQARERQITLMLQQLFHHQTLAALAAALEPQRGSSYQQRTAEMLRFLDELEGANDVY